MKTKLLLLVMILLPLVASAHDIEVKNADGVTIYYNFINGPYGEELYVTFRGNNYSDYREYTGNVVIPQSVIYNEKVYNVTGISEGAFRDCSGLTSVTIPNSVTSIGDSAFEGCSGLTSVTICNSVTSIGDQAFYNCSALTSVTIGNSVTSIGQRAFYGCSKLTSVTIGNSVTSIGEGAFFGCSGLTSFTIPNSVMSIDKRAFSGCSGLTSVTIPNSVTSIGNYAFYGCSGLTSVTIPNSVTSIGSSAFESCSGLTSVTIPNSVTSIGDYAFRYCSALTSVALNSNAIVSKAYTSDNNIKTIFGYQVTDYIIGDEVTSIGDYAFRYCSTLTSVTIGNSVTSIGDYAFSGCSNLTAIIVPANVASIGSYAFNQCTALNNVTIPVSVKTINSRAFYQCTNLANLTIEEGLTTLAADVFQYSGLTSVTLPSTVTSIGNNLFYRCDNLAKLDLSKADKVGSLYALTTINRSATGIFNGIPADCEVILPYGCQATGDHVSIAEPDENSIVIANDGYYELSTAEHWKVFSAITQTVPTANARMTADIDLGDCQAMLGDSEHEDNPTYSYQGTFDGQGHTLTVHYTGTSQTAPFAMLKAATIKNIHVDGTIRNTTGSQPAVIARVISGTTTVENVWSSVITTDTRTGWDEAAAFVGCVDGYKNGHVVMRDCIFTGTVNSSGNYNGCFVGYINSGGSATVSNCLSLGTFNYTGGSYEIARGTYSNCFVKQWPTTIPAAMQVTNDQIADGTTATALQAGRDETVWVQDVLTNQPQLAIFANKYTVPSSGIGTFSAKAKFAVPEGLTAHYCKTYNSAAGTISVANIDGAVPANTGVLLKGTPGETYILTTTTETPAEISDNALVAVVSATHVEPTSGLYTNFMMTNGCFVKIQAASAETKMPANRAYLQILTADLPTGSTSRTITLNWGDETTGIASMEDGRSKMKDVNDTWYTLDGRRMMSKPTQKGVYIYGGHKVVIK